MSFRRVITAARELDKQLHRRRSPDLRRLLVNARTAMNYATLAPIVERLQDDNRLEFYFTASENSANTETIYSEAPKPFQIISPLAAAFMRFDAYLAADFLWVKLPRGTKRVQTFHGVAGKYRTIYDSPGRTMREWDRLFFINEHRLQHFIASGAIDEGSRAACLIGMPKLDCLVDGSLSRDEVLGSLGIDPSRRTVLYAPTWSPYSSLVTMGGDLVRRLGAAGYAVIGKLHDRSRETRYANSGGVDWGARLDPLLRGTGGVLATGSNSSRYLPAADVLITDHSSVGFEYLLLDRPLIRIEVPELIAKTDIEPMYVELLSRASTTVHNVDETITAINQTFDDSRHNSEARRAVAAEMFYKPGSATERAVSEMYNVLELDSVE
ncbi:MAG TPA: CDP-glycerol glycerophosphotransferase family protein [Pyrinomonadaceae bacterium]|nr:CDP-glycerol glycerophosphotransferase family protein [Pyrinomonadaceae bacterium]